MGKKSIWLQCILGTLKGNLLLVIPGPSLMFAEKRVEGSEISCEVGEEVVIVNQPEE